MRNNIKEPIELFRKKIEQLNQLEEEEQLRIVNEVFDESKLTDKDANELDEKVKEGILKLRNQYSQKIGF